uniref:Putative terminase n=1 Tax=viral metagenome TaxID=1070528 RepID=A0A6M3JRC0_9ZZZZ
MLTLESKSPTVIVHHSTYEDNPFLAGDYRRELESLVNQDMNYYRIYTLGEWGRLENVIFSKWEINTLPPRNDWTMWAYGLDFGYTNPSAMVQVVVSGGKLFWNELVYLAKLTNADLIERLSHYERADIYADSAEPDRIEEICRAGLNAYPANKDVKMGLDICRRHPINITGESTHILSEIKAYSYKRDKNGNVLEEPVKFADHSMDAARYATLGLMERFGLPTKREQEYAIIQSFR